MILQKLSLYSIYHEKDDKEIMLNQKYQSRASTVTFFLNIKEVQVRK